MNIQHPTSNNQHPSRRVSSSVRLAAAGFVALFCFGCAGQPVWAAAGEETASNALFAAVDIETTGLDQAADRIVEIAAVKFCGGETVSRRSWLLNPGMPIPKSAYKIHHISNKMVADSPRFADVADELRQFLGDSVLLIHNARFDVAFLSGELKRIGGQGFRNNVVDTLPLFRRWFPGEDSYTLSSLAARFGAKAGVLHRAAADAEMLRGVFETGLRSRQSMTVPELVREAKSASLRISGGR